MNVRSKLDVVGGKYISLRLRPAKQRVTATKATHVWDLADAEEGKSASRGKRVQGTRRPWQYILRFDLGLDGWHWIDVARVHGRTCAIVHLTDVCAGIGSRKAFHPGSSSCSAAEVQVRARTAAIETTLWPIKDRVFFHDICDLRNAPALSTPWHLLEAVVAGCIRPSHTLWSMEGKSTMDRSY